MSKRPVVPDSKFKLDKFKQEVAEDMHVENKIKEKTYMGDMPAKTVGKMASAGNVGGEMVKRMIASVEKEMAKK